jgi:hypothetical protein
MYLLVDGDYFLSGFVPSTEEEVKRAVERLLVAVDEQLLRPSGASSTTSIDFRLIFFSSALLDGLAGDARSCLISSLRRLRFQTHVLESIRGRPGTPVDAALCTKIIQLGLLPTVGAGGTSVGSTKHSFCLVTSNAYVTTALDLFVSRECGEVVFAVYSGDEVAEALLGYASARYGASGGVATVAKQEGGVGVTFVPDTTSAIAALAQVQQQQQGSLPLSTLSELKALQTRLQQENEKSRTGATVTVPLNEKASSTVAPAAAVELPPSAPVVPARPGTEDLFGSHKASPPPPFHPSTAPQAPSSSDDRPDNNNNSSSSSNDSKEAMPVVKPPPEVPTTFMPMDRVSVPPQQQLQQQQPTQPIVPSFFAVGPPRTVTTKTSPAAVAQLASAPTALPPPPLVTTVAAVSAVTGEPEVSTLLPSEWALLYDPTRQRHFFAYTDSTGRSHSTWQHPLGPEKQRDLEEQVQAWRLARVAKSSSQPQPQPQQQPAPSAPLPEGWEQRVDHRTGRTFYVNHLTRTTTWTPPTSTSSTSSSPLPAARPAVAGAAAPGSPEAVNDEWESRVDLASGRTFYVNHRTKQTSWTRPAPQAPQAPSPLPPNWEARVDPSSGRTYYVNHATKTTTWECPAY